MTVIFPMPKFSPFLEHFSVCGPASKFPWGRGVTQIRMWMGSVDLVAFASFFFVEDRQQRSKSSSNSK